MNELRATVKQGNLERAAAAIAQALDAYGKGEYLKAAQQAERAKNDALRSSRIRELLGLAHYNAGSFKEAARELLTYKRFTGRVDQNHVIADCYRALGRPDRALEVLSEISAKKVPPEVWTEAVIVGASAHADRGDIPKALAHIARGDTSPRTVESHHLRLWYVKADLLEKLGRAGEARDLWGRIAREDPEFFDVQDRLAKVT